MILIAGPCVIESKDILKQTIECILPLINKNIDFYFKSSWKKDNRTHSSGYSGLNSQQALTYLVDIKKEYGVKICTDIHSIEDFCLFDLRNIDIIQIPAFLAKQQSLLQVSSEFCNKNDLTLHVKKPQFIGPEDMINIINNAKNFGAQKIIATDRGTMLGYDKVFMDPRHVHIMKKANVPILCDITHPNKNYPGDVIDNSIALTRSYLAAGADGIFLETHPNCEKALCDANTMIPCQKLSQILENI